MDPLVYAKVVYLSAIIVFFAIRFVPCIRARGVPVKRRRVGNVEVFTIVISSIGMLLACVWVAAPLFQFADYTLHPIALTVGSVLLFAGLMLLYQTHVDLGANFSKSLEVRENHHLITNGVYRHVRHPMYLSFLIFSAGQAFVVPNYVVGPSFGVASILIVALRAGPEERMMVEEFGEDYETYRERSNLLIPGVL